MLNTKAKARRAANPRQAAKLRQVASLRSLLHLSQAAMPLQQLLRILAKMWR